MERLLRIGYDQLRNILYFCTMQYKIRCNRCGKVFTIESQYTGKVKCHCPQCSSELVCQVGETSADHVSFRQHVQSMSSQLNSYQQKHSYGDLVIFFSFSVLFILLVIVGLLLCAEITRAVLAGKSWIADLYYNFLSNI